MLLLRAAADVGRVPQGVQEHPGVAHVRGEVYPSWPSVSSQTTDSTKAASPRGRIPGRVPAVAFAWFGHFPWTFWLGVRQRNRGRGWCASTPWALCLQLASKRWIGRRGSRAGVWGWIQQAYRWGHVTGLSAVGSGRVSVQPAYRRGCVAGVFTVLVVRGWLQTARLRSRVAGFLKKLVLGYYFDQPISGVTWPGHLARLVLGKSLNQPVGVVVWPARAVSIVLVRLQPAHHRSCVAGLLATSVVR